MRRDCRSLRQTTNSGILGGLGGSVDVIKNPDLGAKIAAKQAQEAAEKRWSLTRETSLHKRWKRLRQTPKPPRQKTPYSATQGPQTRCSPRALRLSSPTLRFHRGMWHRAAQGPDLDGTAAQAYNPAQNGAAVNEQSSRERRADGNARVDGRQQGGGLAESSGADGQRARAARYGNRRANEGARSSSEIGISNGTDSKRNEVLNE